MNKKTALVACAILIAGGVSFAAVQQGQRAAVDRQERASRQERDLGRRHARLGERMQHRQRGRDFVRSLGVTEQQREQARGVARSLRPLVDEVRPQVRPLIAKARELRRAGDRAAARELLRTEVKPILEGAMARAKPLVRPLVGTLTPDQRAKLEAAASARGRTFDEERFTRRLTRMLARHGARR